MAIRRRVAPGTFALQWFVNGVVAPNKKIHTGFIDHVALDIAALGSLCLNAEARKSGGVCEEHYANGMDKLRRNSGFDRRLSRR